jgi:hypothetical protein
VNGRDECETAAGPKLPPAKTIIREWEVKK